MMPRVLPVAVATGIRTTVCASASGATLPSAWSSRTRSLLHTHPRLPLKVSVEKLMGNRVRLLVRNALPLAATRGNARTANGARLLRARLSANLAPTPVSSVFPTAARTASAPTGRCATPRTQTATFSSPLLRRHRPPLRRPLPSPNNNKTGAETLAAAGHSMEKRRGTRLATRTRITAGVAWAPVTTGLRTGMLSLR